MRLPLALAACASLALAACGSSKEEAAPAPETTATPDIAPAPVASPSETPVSAIPAAVQGRWALVPADCDPARSDNKGLLTISAQELRFYESVGTLGSIADANANHIRASFAFTGEGMNWTRDMSLSVEDGGSVMIRREHGGGDAMPDPLRYTRCPSNTGAP